MMNKKTLIILLIIIVSDIFIYNINNLINNKIDNTQINNSVSNGENMKLKKIKLIIDEHELTATLYDNTSSEKLIEILELGTITIDMEDYNQMEKVGNLGTYLPTNDEYITTNYGDLILYNGNKFVIYYDSNSWNLTRLGKIDNISQPELKQILGNGDIKVLISLI